MIKLIATDMDGTFLDNRKQFDKSFIDLFFEMKEQGVLFVAASGNQYARLYQKFLPMSEDMYFIADGGSYIAKGPNTLEVFDIDRKKAFLAMERVREHHPEYKILVAGEKFAYARKHDHLDKALTTYYCAYKYVDDFNEIDEPITKIALCDPSGDIRKTCGDIESILPEGLQIITSGNEWMDIQREGVNKGLGMRYIQEHEHISRDECLAFGDQMNDYALLESVKYGFAMENAVDEIKKLAYGITDSNEDQGCLKIIKKALRKNKEQASHLL